MNYIELSVSVEPKELGSDLLIAQLAELGFESFVDSDEGFSAFINEDNYVEEQIKELFLEYISILKIETTSKIIPQQNWNMEWESNFQPIEVKGKCYIRAPFHEAKKGFIYDIIIEPKMSFGTGHHHTTQLMIQKMMELDLKNKSLLDMGCGTGVLAVLASKMGATPIMAIDIDDWSYENSIENSEKNNIINIVVHKGNVKKIVGQLFYTILANINKNVLLADLSFYYNSLENGGNLLLSGFFDTDVNEILNKTEVLGLALMDKLVNEQWTMLYFIKK
jgi:ribosomal protein L11 methyltransferase